METSKFLSVDEAASYLNVSPWTIYQWVNKNKIKYYKPKSTRKLRFLEADLYEFITGEKVGE